MRWRFFVALTLATVTAGCGAAQRLASSPSPVEPDWLSQVQPFVNRSAPEYVPRHPEPSPYPTTAPPCRASQIRATQGRGGAATGNILLLVNFINVSQVPCRLSGTPRVEGVDPAGRLVTLPVTGNGTFFLDPIPADLAPGETGYLNIGMENAGNCPGAAPAVVYTNLRFELPGGGWIITNLTADNACGVLDISGLGKAPGPVLEPTPNPGTVDTLRVAAERVPDSVRAGTTLDFIIALTNNTDLAISLSPCPSYTVFVNPGTVLYQSRYLNCDHVTVIPPRTTVRYAMELPIPAEPSWQTAKFGWSLNTPSGFGAGDEIQITN